MKKRILLRVCAFWMIVLMILPSLMACKPPSSYEELTTEEKQETEKPAPETDLTETGEITMEFLKECVLIYPQDPSGLLFSKMIALQAAIRTATGVKVPYRDDFLQNRTDYVESKYEILIGCTNREASRTYCGMLRSEDYGYDVIGTKMVIAGRSDGAVSLAIDAFIENVLKAYTAESDVVFRKEDAVRVDGTYETGKVFLGGVELSQYCIVYPKGNTVLRLLAESFADTLEAQYSYRLPTYDDKTTPVEYELWFGDVNRITETTALPAGLGDMDCALVPDGTSILFWGTNVSANYAAAEMLLDMIKGNETADGCSLEIPSPITMSYVGAGIRTISVDVSRLRDVEKDGIMIVAAIAQSAPDIVMLQEASADLCEMLVRYLKDQYEFLRAPKHGMDSRGGTEFPILYRKGRLEAVESGIRWLTKTPDKPSWLNLQYRYDGFLSHATFRVTGTEEKFLCVNAGVTDMETMRNNVAVRELQLGYILEFLKPYRDAGTKILLAGDLCLEDDAEKHPRDYVEMLQGEGFSKAESVAEVADMPGVEKYPNVWDYLMVCQNIRVSFFRCYYVRTDSYLLLDAEFYLG